MWTKSLDEILSVDYDKNKVLDLPIWEGDKLIFEGLEKEEYFRLKLVYNNDLLILSENY